MCQSDFTVATSSSTLLLAFAIKALRSFFVRFTYLVILLVFLVLLHFLRKKNPSKEPRNTHPLDKTIRIACFVLTQTKNHESRVRAVSDTWGRRCSVLIYVTNCTDHLEDQSVFNIKKMDSYNTIWGKVKYALRVGYERYKEEVDWFMKADDDSYVIMENMQNFIQSKGIGPEDPTWFGPEYRLYSKHGYMAGGGYVMSREAVRRFVYIGLNRTTNEGCKVLDDHGAEDVEMGKCMSTVGVSPTDSRDQYGRTRNFPFNLTYMTTPRTINKSLWFWRYIKYPVVFGHPGCCSETTSITHKLTAQAMYMYEYLIYVAKVSGERLGERDPPPPETLAINRNINWTDMQYW